VYILFDLLAVPLFFMVVHLLCGFFWDRRHRHPVIVGTDSFRPVQIVINAPVEGTSDELLIPSYSRGVLDV
jgi:hypothetical protein